MQVLVVVNDRNKDAIEASFSLYAYLGSLGIGFDSVMSKDMVDPKSWPVLTQVQGKDFDLAVVLGGDGTILRTARFLAYKDTQILGINFGHLGFLANSSSSGVIDLVSRALAQELSYQYRSNLHIHVACEGEELDDTKSTECKIGEYLSNFTMSGSNSSGLSGMRNFFALNEVVLNRGELGRILDFSFAISGQNITHFRGDGMIVASATGSTAYSLAAGGPIVNPSFQGLVVTPLAPHTLTARSVLADSNDVVNIKLESDPEYKKASLFIDGDLVEFPTHVVEMLVSRGPSRTCLLYEDADHFYKAVEDSFFE